MTYHATVATATFNLPCQDTAASSSLTGGGTIVGGDTAATLTNTNGPTTWLPRALNLDGTNDYITTSFDLSTLGSAWTIEGWYYVNSGSLQTALNNFFFGTTTDNRIGASWGHTTAANRGGGAVYQSNATYTGPGPITLPSNTWFHLVVQVQGTAMRCYVNGVLVGSTTVDSLTRAGTLIVCSRNGGNNKLAGRIATLRIYPSGTVDAADLYAGPEPAYTSGSITLNADLSYSGDLVWDSQSNGTVTETTTLEHYIAGQWEEDPDGFTVPVPGRDYRVRIAASNNGGNDPDEDRVSNTVTYVAPSTRRAFTKRWLYNY